MLKSKYNSCRNKNILGIVFGIICMIIGVYFFFKDISYNILSISFVIIIFYLIDILRNENEYKKEETKEIALSFISAIFMTLIGIFSKYKIAIFLGISLIVLEIIKIFRKKRKKR